MWQAAIKAGDEQLDRGESIAYGPAALNGITEKAASPWSPMSFPEPLPLFLPPKAERDFIDSLRYTGETWGESQLLAYRD